MLDLSNNIILVAFGSTKVSETIKAIKYCQKLVKFYDTLYLTDHIINEPGIRHIPTRNIPSYKDYQVFIVKESPDLILSSIPDSFNGHFLCINWDGFIINVNAWNDNFLDYDYIGAPWPTLNHMVGNGGFCLKSKKFLLTQQILCKNYHVTKTEDFELCLFLRESFEQQGCVYADHKIGYKFSTEGGNYYNNHSFGFHSFVHNKQFLTLIS